MKNILVLMHDDAGQEARFQAALDIVRALDGHLTCVDVTIVPAYVGDYAVCGGAALLIADEEDRERANRISMQARLEAETVPYGWIDQSGIIDPCLREASAMADLVVLNRELDSIPFPDMQALVGEMVLKTGKPIVAVPETARGFDLFGNALVAWDGSREAEAALRAAVPLLRKAAVVTIVEVDDGSIRMPAEDAAEYLSRHGIKPAVRCLKAEFDKPSTILLRAITVERAAYLVMGGFGHSRFREAAFGGVTRRMLKECPVPLFLAH